MFLPDLTRDGAGQPLPFADPSPLPNLLEQEAASLAQQYQAEVDLYNDRLRSNQPQSVYTEQYRQNERNLKLMLTERNDRIVRQNFLETQARMIARVDRDLEAQRLNPNYFRDQVIQENNRRARLDLEDLRERNRRLNINNSPAAAPPSTTQNQPPPTSVDNTPALRTPQTSGIRAPNTATSRPRPASPSTWQLYQPVTDIVNSVTPNRSIPRPASRSTPPSSPQVVNARMGGAAAYGLVDFGWQVANGADVGRAAYRAAGGVAGGLVGQQLGTALGSTLGALAGPAGIGVGGVIGGALGGALGGGAAAGVADRYYPGNNAPLPGAPIPGQIESVPVPRPFSGPNYIPGPAVPFDPSRPGDRRPRLGDLPNPNDPVSGLGPFFLQWQFRSGSPLQRDNPVIIPAGYLLHGPISISTRYESATREWTVTLTHFGNSQGPRSATPISDGGTDAVGWPEQPPFNFTARNLAQPGAPTQPFNPLAPWPPSPEAAPRTHPANDANQQYYPNPIPQASPSPTGRPAGEPDPGNLGGSEPELVPQRPPDGTPQPGEADRAYPNPNSPTGGNRPGGGSSFPTIPLFPVGAPSPLPAQRRARVTTNARRPQPTALPRGAGPPNQPPRATNPQEPCSGNRCAQRQLEGINGANNRLDQLTALMQVGDNAANAAILRRLDEINAKLGPQIPGGGLANFMKRLWDSLGLQKILNLLTFVTVLHNAYWMSNSITQTLFGAFDNVLRIFGGQLKNAEGENIDTSEWVGDQVESFFNSIFGTETVDGIKEGWAKFSRIYQAASNIWWGIQSMLYSVQEALETVGNYVALIGNAARKYGVFIEKAYGWMNPNLNFRHNRFFRGLEIAEDAASALENVTGEVLNVTETWEEVQKDTVRLREELSGIRINSPPEAPRSASVTNTPENTPVLQFESELSGASINVIQPIPPEAEQNQGGADE